VVSGIGTTWSGSGHFGVRAALANAREDERENPGLPEHLARRRGRLDRLRRRRDDELRDWIDLHAARNRSVVIEAHVRSALEFVDILAERLGRPQAIAFYLRTANVPAHLEREVQSFALERLARRHLPLPLTFQTPYPDIRPASWPDETARDPGSGSGEASQ
jgi:hypothetical protein